MNKFAFLLIILLSSLIFSGCTPQKKSQSQNFELTSTKVNLQNNQETQSNSEINPPQEGPSMKTLADFPEIEAQEATLVTNKGEITLKLFRDRAPLTTANFLSLAQDGFYDGVVFHRVIDDFMAQVGDPKSKDPSLKSQWGTGGPGYQIEDEFHPELTHQQKGVVSMANSGPNTGGSQFFITYEATPWLDNKHAVFGQVTNGLAVLDQIEQGDKIIEVTFQ